jgi:galactokinase
MRTDAGVRAFAPGRVNLIGDHTDYAGGLALPMAIDLGTTVEGSAGGEVVLLRSTSEPVAAQVPLDVTAPAAIEPAWARYVAGVVAEVRPAMGFVGSVTTTLPVGAGLSSSASLELAVALVLGCSDPPLDLAARCQRAEQAASGVPCGIMDQLASAAGRAGHALLVDFATLAVEEVRLPDGVEVWVVHSGEARRLAGSAYAERRAACEAAAGLIGPLASASAADVAGLADPVLRRRARHVAGECERVRAMAAALRAGDLPAAGGLMDESHASLRDDFEVSTPPLDELCERLRAVPGVVGARLTGAGFGGCAVALAEAGSTVDETAEAAAGLRAWRVEAADGARLLSPR